MTKVRELKPQENLAGLSGGSGGNSADDPGASLLCWRPITLRALPAFELGLRAWDLSPYPPSSQSRCEMPNEKLLISRCGTHGGDCGSGTS